MSKEQIIKDFLSPDLKKDGPQVYLKKIGSAVSTHSGKRIEVNKKKFKVGALKDTSYSNKLELLDEWEQFYLPDHMGMEVLGVFENFPCSVHSAELVLMVCEDGNVFAYEDDRLHLVAENLKKLFDSGIQFPAKKSFYRGESFEKMTPADWDQVKKSKEVMKEREKHQKMLKSIKPSLLKNLAIIDQRHQAEATGAAKVKPEAPAAQAY